MREAFKCLDPSAKKFSPCCIELIVTSFVPAMSGVAVRLLRPKCHSWFCIWEETMHLSGLDIVLSGGLTARILVDLFLAFKQVLGVGWSVDCKPGLF